MSHPVQQFMTVQEVAAMINISEKTVRRLIWDGRLPAIRVGDSDRSPLRIPVDGLNDWLYGEGM